MVRGARPHGLVAVCTAVALWAAGAPVAAAQPAAAQGADDPDREGSPAAEDATAADDGGLAPLDAPPPPDAGELAEPPAPHVPVVEHQPGASLPPSWRPRPAPEPPPATRSARLPGDFTARPLVLPGGTFAVAFDVTTVFLEVPPLTTYLPRLALGVTSDLEIGASVPTRYDRGENAWTALDPAPHVAVRLLARERVELGARATVLIPASSDARTHGELLVPLLWRPTDRVRVDAGVGVELGFEDRVETVLRWPLGLSFQLLEWLFAGTRVTGDLGLTEGREASLDGEVFVGLTVQARGTAYFDLLARFFAVNLGGGGRGAASDGGGIGVTARFFPRAF